jgi:hypothetical protein
MLGPQSVVISWPGYFKRVRAFVAIAGAVVLGGIGATCLFSGAWMTISVIDGGPEPEIGNTYIATLGVIFLLIGFACTAGAVAAFRARA